VKSSGAPPTVVCGVTLNSSAAGALLYETARNGKAPGLSVGGRAYVRVSASCTRGADVELSPPGAACVVRVAPAKDGLPAAVVVQLIQPVDRITVRSHRGSTATGQLDIPIGADAPASSAGCLPTPRGVVL
jgi:hypothetical protein